MPRSCEQRESLRAQALGSPTLWRFAYETSWGPRVTDLLGVSVGRVLLSQGGGTRQRSETPRAGHVCLCPGPGYTHLPGRLTEEPAHGVTAIVGSNIPGGAPRVRYMCETLRVRYEPGQVV